MKEILLVSNRILENSNFIYQLKSKYTVDDMGYISTALLKLKKPDKYGLAIIEVSMPVYDVYTLKETSDGFRTGIVFYEREIKRLGIPVIFWSWIDDFRDEIAKLDGKVTFLRKEMDTDHLLNAVTKFVGKL